MFDGIQFLEGCYCFNPMLHLGKFESSARLFQKCPDANRDQDAFCRTETKSGALYIGSILKMDTIKILPGSSQISWRNITYDMIMYVLSHTSFKLRTLVFYSSPSIQDNSTSRQHFLIDRSSTSYVIFIQLRFCYCPRIEVPIQYVLIQQGKGSVYD